MATPKIRPIAAVTAIARAPPDGHSQGGTTKRRAAEMTAKRTESRETDKRQRGDRGDP